MLNKLTSKNLYDIWSSELECISILDFRPSNIFAESRIPGSKSLSGRVNILNKEYFTCCADVSFILIDAPKVVRDMVVNGRDIENVFEVNGGIEAWVKSGYPTAPLKFKTGGRKVG